MIEAQGAARRFRLSATTVRQSSPKRRSRRRNISDGRTSRAAPICISVRMYGLRSPRSIRLIVVRSVFISRAKLSCEMSRSSRTSRNTCPNCFSRPSEGWICLLRDGVFCFDPTGQSCYSEDKTPADKYPHYANPPF
jgi:hypothetical protein